MSYAKSDTTEHPPTEDPAVDNAVQTRLSCLLEGLPPAQRDKQRIQTLSRLNLLGADSVPVLDEATQTVSRLLAMPICILSVIDAEMQLFKSVVGLSSLGLMNQLAAARSLPRQESFCTHVIDSGKAFALEDAAAHPAFSRSLLVQQYGIHSYLGVPLVTTEGCCIGTLAIMDLLPHRFTHQERAFLELSARWCMSELEKQHLLASLNRRSSNLEGSARQLPEEDSLLTKIKQVRFDLIVQLAQDLRNPLTSITGMANMLSREIYGPLSDKQQEYTKIVLSSSQQLLNRVDEIMEVGDLKEDFSHLSLAATDIEMVGQQAIAALEDLAKQQDLKVKLTVEPGSRIWNLDKRLVKQLLYQLVFSIIKMSTAGSTIRLHVSRRSDSINIALWVSNPWLGEDLPQAIIVWDKEYHAQQEGWPPRPGSHCEERCEERPLGTASQLNGYGQLEQSHQSAKSPTDVFTALATAQKVDASRQELGLLLSRHLTKMHGGESFVQGSTATGYRYVISLPALDPTDNLS